MPNVSLTYILSVLRRCLKVVCASAFLLLCSSFLIKSSEPTALDKVMQSGRLVMISRNGPTTYYEDADGYAGFEYELGKAFAEYLGLELQVQEEPDLGVMLNDLSLDRGDFAAASLTVTKPREFMVDFGPEYGQVSQKLIYRAGTKKPRKVEDIIGGTLVVIGDSSHEQNLVSLKKTYPNLKWDVLRDAEMMDLLELVHLGEVDYTIVDSIAHDMSSALYPKARIAFDISQEQSLAWAFKKQTDKSLIDSAERFFSLDTTQKLIAENRERYYGHTGNLNYGGSVLFVKRLKTRLPKWRDKLVQAGEISDVDWKLLAALSYQESHWDPEAVSPTGVKGFMMLTLAAAKDVGVTNRLNADQSIQGGAEYFRRIYGRIPDRIPDPDRLWLALAAYNVGLGHLEDARVLTKHYGDNPDKWSDVKEYLLKLSKRKYYKFTDHGYARGWEAVGYVENIRTFYNIIAWHERGQDQLALSEQGPKYEEFSPVVTKALKELSGSNSSSEL